MSTLTAEPNPQTMTKERPIAKSRDAKRRKPAANGRRTAESMAKMQREISVSEFFAKNRHLLGFDNPRKAMLTTVKEAVDNALDACEDGGILPAIFVQLMPVSETRFRITIRDNGPGIVRSQIDNIFGKLLYGSKFHRMKMSRGQQGIGISAAGMYGLMTTGKPVVIISKTSKRKPAHEVTLKIDTSKNRPEVVKDEPHPEDDVLFPEGHGTQVTIELEGKYLKGRQSIDEYLEQTAIANPHAQITYITPGNETVEFPRTIDELPEEPKEIKPHPKGIELGTLIQMLERTQEKQLGGFFKTDFCRVGPGKAKEIAEKAKLSGRTWVKSVTHEDAERLYAAIQDVRITAPPTDCLSPIGVRPLLAGLLKEVKGEFYAASTRPPAVYRGNPFQIEAAIAFGGNLPGDQPARLIRFANRVPLLYQQSACSSFKAVTETNWRNYALSQPTGSLPTGPLVIMLHMASVWVPFTSESKEAIADYDEIRKEMKLALQECGRKLGTYLRKRKKMRREADRRSVFERYIGEIARASHAICEADAEALYEALMKQAKRKTAKADDILDEDGNVIRQERNGFERDDSVIVVEEAADEAARRASDSIGDSLFDDQSDGNGNGNGKGATTGKKRRTKKKSKRRTKRS